MIALAPQIPVAVAAVDLPEEGTLPRVIDANDAFLRLWGHRSLAAVVGRPADAGWADALRGVAARAELFADRTWVQFVQAGTGEGARDIEVTAVLQRAAGGEPSHVLVTFFDATARARAERALRESEQRLRNLAANLPGVIFRYVLHPDGREELPYMSPACLDIWELPAEHLMRDLKPLWAMVDRDDVAGLSESVMASADTLRPWLYEWRIATPSGRVKWLHGAGRPERLPSGAIGWDSLILDITALKQAEAGRRLSEARLSAVFAESPVGLAILDGECRYTHVNPTLAAMNGVPPEQHIGRLPSDLLPPELGAGIEACARGILASGKPDLDREFCGETSAQPGVARSWLSSQFPITDGHGQAVGVGFVVQETTAQRRAEAARAELEAKLVQAQRLEAIGRLAGGIAHDFNNLLTVILANAEEAELDAPAGSPQAERLHEVRAAARRSAELTRQLLAFARRQVVQPQVLAVDAEVQNMVDMLRRLIGEHLTLAWRPGAPGVNIEMDTGQLGQILTNLVVNARDASSGGGSITVATAIVDRAAALVAPQGFVRISVADEGRGMDPATQAQMFEPFFTTKGGGRGTGLGLATVHGIVMQNGGVIDVRSAVGAGTTIDVYLPRHAGVAAATASALPTQPAAHGGAVLLVEDEPQILAVGKRILEQLGYSVLATTSALAAVELGMRADVAIDLLVTDLVMPELGGREVATRLVQARPGLKVLFLSGYFHELAARAHMPIEGALFLSKPFTAADIAAKVREALGR